MSDLQGNLLVALDAINEISNYMELVKIAVEQLNHPGPKQLDRLHLLLDLYQDGVNDACGEAVRAIESARKSGPDGGDLGRSPLPPFKGGSA